MTILSKQFLAGGALVLTVSANGLARTLEAVDPVAVARPSELRWQPKETLPAGAFAAVAHGDPHAGPYAFYGRFPSGFRVPAHWHSADVEVILLAGTMHIERDGAAPRTIAPDEYVFLPAGLAYAAHCPEGCLFLAWGREPFDIHYVRAEDDPRPAGAK
jgi:hypothetical protein